MTSRLDLEQAHPQAAAAATLLVATDIIRGPG